MSSVASNCHHDNDDENVDHHRSRDEAEKEEEEFVAKNEFGVTMGIGGSDDDAVFEEPMSWANALWYVFRQISSGKRYMCLYYLVASCIAISVLCDFAFSARVNGDVPENLSCRSWIWSDFFSCGVDATKCLPFDNETYSFRCPGRCNWRGTDGPYEFWGDNDNGYHPKSRICPAAIHAGAISRNGGCVRMRLGGAVRSFQGSVGHGSMASLTLDTPYYKSFVFEDADDTHACYGNAYQFGAVLVVGTILLSGTVAFPSFFSPPSWLLVLQAVVFGVFYQHLVLYLPDAENGPAAFDAAIGSLSSLMTLLFCMWHFDRHVGGPLKLLDEPKADARRASAADDDSIPFRPVVEAAAADERGVKREAENKTLSDTRVQPAPRSSPFLSCDRHLVEKWLKSRLFVYAALFVVPYMTGIHISFFSHIDGFDVTFDSSVFDSAGDSTTGVVALVLLLTMMVAIFVVHLRLACVKDVWKSMVTTCLGVLVVVALTYGLFFSDSNLASVSFHFHHATIGIIIVALVRFPNKVSLIVAALFIGSIVDGICKWSEWNWLSTWTVENPASSAEVNVDFPSVQPPSLHILFPNITATSIALTWPSAELLSSALNATCVGVALHMNNDPSAVLLYDRLGSNTGVCGALRCEQDVRGLFSNTAYSFQYACIDNLGNYQYNPVGWEASTL